jgi:hypothetical protein
MLTESNLQALGSDSPSEEKPALCTMKFQKHSRDFGIFNGIKENPTNIYQAYLMNGPYLFYIRNAYEVNDQHKKKLHMIPETDWKIIVHEVTDICEKYNGKWRKLVSMVKFNRYRSFIMMTTTAVSEFYGRFSPSDIYNLGEGPSCGSFLLCVFLFSVFGIFIGGPVTALLYIFSILLDGLLFFRFFNTVGHKAYLASILTGNPDLNPALYDEDFESDLTEYSRKISEKYHIDCTEKFVNEHVSHYGSTNSYDLELYELIFREKMEP